MIKNSEKSKLYCELIDTYRKYSLHYEQARNLLLLIDESNLLSYEKAVKEHLDAQNLYIKMLLIFEEMIDMM
ncbi:MAG: hypothetical protein PUP92_22690 [Rhizonema sp. PD38]|nr:hypothetical protein [Rhizonema sp. PD38]